MFLSVLNFFLAFLRFFPAFASISSGKNKKIQALVKSYVFLTQKLGCSERHRTRPDRTGQDKQETKRKGPEKQEKGFCSLLLIVFLIQNVKVYRVVWKRNLANKLRPKKFPR